MQMRENKELRIENGEGTSLPPVKRILKSEELFGAEREIRIRHLGQEYRLQVTRNGKLILTK